MGSLEPFNRLVRLTARAFYDDISIKGDTQAKTSRGDNRGMASAKGAKIYSAAAAAAGDGQPTKEGEEKVKLHTHSYCCLDYAQMHLLKHRSVMLCGADTRMKKTLKDELDSRNTVQHYICPNCKKRYSAFDALQLISYTDERRREKLNDMQQRIDEQLKPLQAQLKRVKDLPAPEFGSLQSWERLNLGAFAHGDSAAAEAARNAQGQYNGTPMPYLGDTKVDVELAGSGVKKKVLNLAEMDSKEDEKSIQDEYLKAYYEAFKKKQEEEDAKRMQQEGQAFSSEIHSEAAVRHESQARMRMLRMMVLNGKRSNLQGMHRRNHISLWT
ncbi:hypothetical protein ZWY2020_026320 [Hordeum vulgare]|nr:hypothetical protein ZWY2020_026320 [Hordeum vulgare]